MNTFWKTVTKMADDNKKRKEEGNKKSAKGKEEEGLMISASYMRIKMSPQFLRPLLNQPHEEKLTEASVTTR